MARRRRDRAPNAYAMDPMLAALLKTPDHALAEARRRAMQADIDRRLDRQIAAGLEQTKRLIKRKPDQVYYRKRNINKSKLGEFVKYHTARLPKEMVNSICMDRAVRKAVMIAGGKANKKQMRRITWESYVKCRRR